MQLRKIEPFNIAFPVNQDDVYMVLDLQLQTVIVRVNQIIDILNKEKNERKD